MDEFNKNIPEETTAEETKTTEIAEESAETPEPYLFSNETAEGEATEETADEEETTEEAPLPSRPAGLLRSAITAAVVLAVFAAVYFIFTAFNGNPPAPTQPSEPKAPVETTISGSPDANAENAGAVTPDMPEEAPNQAENSEEAAPSQAPAPAVTTEEEPSPEYKAATDVITADAKAKYGEGIMVLPEYNSELRNVKINGEEHRCYLAAVVKMTSDSSSLPIIHSAVDADTNTVWYDDEVTIEVLD